MRDPRCWQAQTGHFKPLPGERIQAEARALAHAVDGARLWPERIDDETAPSLSTPGVRERFVSIVESDVSLRRAWTDHLTDRVKAIPTLVGRDRGFEREISADQMALVLRQWAEVKSPSLAWDHRSRRLDYVPDVGAFGYANLLLQIAPAAAAVAFEALQLPTFIEQAMQWGDRLSEDRDRLLTVLDAAPLVFDEGRWTRNVVALLAMERVLEHPQAVAGALRQLEHDNPWRATAESKAAHATALATFRENEAPEWFRVAFERVLARGDGREVLSLFAPFVSQKILRGNHQEFGRPRWEPYAAARAELASVLRQSGVVTAHLHRGWEAHRAGLDEAPPAKQSSRGKEPIPVGEGARTLVGDGVVHLMGALSLLLESSAASEAEATWAWFEELLRGRDPGFEFLDHAAGADGLQRELGALLSRLPDALAAFAKTYRLLEPQRRRAEHGYRYQEYQRNIESVLLLRVGLFGAAGLAGTGSSAARSAELLFHQAFQHARRLWLTKGGGDHSGHENLVAECFAFVPTVFGTDAAATIPSLVAPIGSDNGLCLAAAAFLWKNGVPVDSIIALFAAAQVDLIEAAREELAWWAEEKARPDWFQQLQPFLGHLEPERVESRRAAIRARAFQRFRDDALRGGDMLEDWLLAEREIAAEVLRDAGTQS